MFARYAKHLRHTIGISGNTTVVGEGGIRVLKDYQNLKAALAKGWNTWNTRSVLSHVILPEGVAVNLGVKEYATGQYLRETLIGRSGPKTEVVRPGPHAYDGSYTALSVSWSCV